MVLGKVFEVNGKFIGYNAENLKIFKLSREEAEILEMYLKGLREEEIGEKFSAEDVHGIIEKFNSKNPKLKLISGKDVKPSILELLVSTDCNMRCSYCFAGGGNYNEKRELMSEETAFKAIELFNTIGELKSIHFFGGEPLMNSKLIKKIVSHYGKSLSYGITTNGTIMSDDMIKLFKEYNAGVLIDIDGEERYHDMNRRYKNGKGTYNDIVKNLKKLKEAGVPLNLGAVIAENAVKASGKTYEEYIRGVWDHLHILGADTISVGAVHNKGPSRELFSCQEKCIFLRKEIDPDAIVFRYIRQQISSRAKLVDTPVCMGLLNGIAVYPNGDAYPCFACEEYGASYCYGNVKNNFNHYEEGKKSVMKDFSRDILWKDCWFKDVIPASCVWWHKRGKNGYYIPEETFRYEEELAKIVLYDIAYEKK